MEDLGHRMGQRAAMGVVGYRAFKDHHKFNIISNILNSLSHLVTRTSPWSLEKENKKANHSLLVTDLHPLYETDI
jgi:hypothetical protein